jgi:26S proteasome regulatory subunit T2
MGNPCFLFLSEFLLVQIHTAKMTLAEDVNLEEFVMTKDEFSGADIKAICTEAGLLALRERRMKVRHHRFVNQIPSL